MHQVMSAVWKKMADKGKDGLGVDVLFQTDDQGWPLRGGDI